MYLLLFFAISGISFLFFSSSSPFLPSSSVCVVLPPPLPSLHVPHTVAIVPPAEREGDKESGRVCRDQNSYILGINRSLSVSWFTYPVNLLTSCMCFILSCCFVWWSWNSRMYSLLSCSRKVFLLCIISCEGDQYS